MNNLTKRFNRISKDNPNLSSFICFAKALEGQHYHTDFVLQAFNDLVEKKDYLPSEKDDLLKHLNGLK